MSTIVRDLTIGESKVDAGLENPDFLARVTVDTNSGKGSSAVYTQGSGDGESASNKSENFLFEQVEIR